jgi:hypothetical protein
MKQGAIFNCLESTFVSMRLLHKVGLVQLESSLTHSA